MSWALPPLPPARDIESREVLRKAASAHRFLAELKGVSRSVPNPAVLINSLGLQEARDSSAIENIVTTHDELYRDTLFPDTELGCAEGTSWPTSHLQPRSRQSCPLGIRPPTPFSRHTGIGGCMRPPTAPSGGSAACASMQAMGWRIAYGPDMAPDMPGAERRGRVLGLPAANLPLPLPWLPLDRTAAGPEAPTGTSAKGKPHRVAKNGETRPMTVKEGLL